jgi:hypothetical protein
MRSNKMKRLIIAFLIISSIYNFGYALTEEEIFDTNSEHLSLYSLSNDIGEIENAILARTGISISLRNAGWRLTQNISSNIKDTMNRLNINYAMTSYLPANMPFSFAKVIIVFRRVGEQWFTYMHIEIDENFRELLKE